MKRPVSDADLDRLLTAPCRGTTPEFERRLAALADAVAPGAVRSPFAVRTRRWWPWTLPLAAAAAVALWVAVPRGASPPPDFDALLELDAQLAGAAPLLDDTARELCLEFPTHLDSSRS